MAEYEAKVRAEAPINFDLTNVRESVKGLSNMESRLNQLSQVLYRDLVAKKQREGEEYAVKNRPSVKQIAVAVAKGEDVKKLFAKQGTVFGDSARVVQAELFRQDISQNLDRRISDVLTAIDRGAYEVDAETFANDIQAEIDGAYNVIAEIDPKAALKFKAHGSTVTNTVYEKLNAKQTERLFEEKKATVELQKNAYATLLSENLKISNGDFASAVARSMSVKQDLVNAYEALPLGMTDADWTAITKLEQEVYVNSAVSIIATNKKLMNNFDDTYQGLLSNNPPQELDFYKYLPETAKLDIAQKAKEAFSNEYDIKTKQYTLQNRNAQKKVAALESAWSELQKKTDIDDPDREKKIKQIESDLERITLTNPEVYSRDSFRKFTEGEYREINELEPDVRDIKRRISNQEFPDWADVVETARREYPNTFQNEREIRDVLGDYFLDEAKRAIDTVSDDIVNDNMFIHQTSSERNALRQRLKRRINNQIAENQRKNRELAEGEKPYTTDAREIGMELLKRTESIAGQQVELSKIQNNLQTIVTNNRIIGLNPSASTFKLNEEDDKLLRKKLSKKEYNTFITLYQELEVKRSEIAQLGAGLF